ncbi:sensor domain-containing diguanylate cyclase [Hydrogenophaga aquatica]
MFDHLADAVYLIDPESSRIVWGNRMAWASLGLTREEVVNHSVLSLQKDVTGLPQWSDIAQVIRQSECFRFLGRHRHTQGHEVAVEVNTTRFHWNAQEYFLSVARDITTRVAQETMLHEREQRLWYALNEASDGLWDWDVATGHLYFSPQLKRMLGYGPEEMAPVLESWSQNVHPEDSGRVMAVLNEHLQGQRVRYEAEYRLRNRNGHYLWVHDRGSICERTPDGRPARVVGMVQDITDRKQLQFQLERLASHDVLTGLPNRRQGELFLQSQVALCKRLDIPIGLAFIDIDHFKSINDVHGHLSGDQVLQMVGEAVRGAVRASDMVCRWGGEEFLIIAPNTPLEHMKLLAEKARQAVQQCPAVKGLPEVTISLGVATCNGQTEDADSLLAQADAALYRAKAMGRNRVEYVAG